MAQERGPQRDGLLQGSRRRGGAGAGHELGARGTLTASSGNAASAVAAYSAAAGLDCLVLVGPGSAPNKLQQVLAYGAQVLVVEDLFRTQDGLLGLLEEVSQRLDRLLVFFWALSNPYTIEGMKTIAYELWSQTGGELPDAVVVPTGGGDLYTGIWRGFCELRRVGLVDRVPRMLAAQAMGAAPLARAVAAGAERVAQLDTVKTVASGIRVAFTGDHALRALRESGGAVVSVSDQEILAMQRRLATRVGVWVEPTAAVSVAAIPHFLEQGVLRADERVVCILTGAGYKDVPTEARADVESLLAATPLPLDASVVANHAPDRASARVATSASPRQQSSPTPSATRWRRSGANSEHRARRVAKDQGSVSLLAANWSMHSRRAFR